MEKNINHIELIFNFDKFEELHTATGFSLFPTLYNAIENLSLKQQFFIDGIDFKINLPFSLVYKNYADLSIDTLSEEPKDLDRIKNDTELQRKLLDYILKFIEEFNFELHSVVIPIENFDNIIYSDIRNKFFVSVEEPSPKTINLSFTTSERDIDNFFKSCLR